MKHPTERHLIERELRDRGVQPTSQRIEVLHHLRLAGHLTADELHGVLNADYSRVSRATVYNTLTLFKEQGLIREIMLEPGRSIFDGNDGEHYHFYNEDTKEIIDVPADQVALTCLPGYPVGKEFRGADIVIRIGEPKPD